ncbi:MAG: adenylate/guanylate cyclase domain-containing protein [Gemmatimonadaceae bacterium]|nr:adenylate/guanylate cyclase domain-containing protein [Gemmatimonadaceae bacterium]
MALADELRAAVAETIKSRWSEREGRIVPADSDVKLLNDCVKLNATVLYADIDESTKLVDAHKPHLAAEVYKTFLYCASRVIRSEGGEITAFDGDRVMAVFVGDTKNTSAARTALKLNDVRTQIINPAIVAQYGAGAYQLRHVVGVDTSELHAVKAGIRGSNDLAWIGRAANHAAKLCTLPADYSSYITEEVFKVMQDDVKVSNGKSMWERVSWTATGRIIYRSSWRWPV